MRTGKRNLTGANRANGDRKEILCSLRFLLLKSGPGDCLIGHDQFKSTVLAEEGRTGANRGNGEGNQILCSLCFLLLKSGPGGAVKLDFDKSITDGVNLYAKRDGDAEIGLFSDEVVVNCVP